MQLPKGKYCSFVVFVLHVLVCVRVAVMDIPYKLLSYQMDQEQLLIYNNALATTS